MPDERKRLLFFLTFLNAPFLLFVNFYEEGEGEDPQEVLEITFDCIAVCDLFLFPLLFLDPKAF